MSVESSLPPEENAREVSGRSDIMTWEEYRTHYVMRQKQLYEKQRQNASNARNNTHGTDASATATSHNEQEQQQGALRQAEAEFNLWDRIEPHQALIAQCVEVFWRVIVATWLFFRSVTIYHVSLTIALYVVWLVLQFALTSIRVERDHVNSERNAPRLAASAGRPRRDIFLGRKIMYVVTRCLTSFVLSLSPTYSVEQLEAELLEDGIVTAHPHQD